MNTVLRRLKALLPSRPEPQPVPSAPPAAPVPPAPTHEPPPPAAPPIRVQQFPRLHPELFRDRGPAAREGIGLTSQVCRFGTLDSPTFRRWVTRLGDTWNAHRKMWELAYICQVLEERGLLAAGTHGLGFAVGAEKLPAFLAARGCRITATDLPAEDERNRAWAATGQWVGNLEALNAHGLCPAAEFRDRVRYRPVDMNDIPADLGGYDFTWSTCSFEHCGSVELGLRFLERQMACLRPGGLAIHTTEFNLTSNDDTIADGPCVIFRLRDIEEVCRRLVDQGHTVEPLDVDPGSHEIDRFVDPPPYYESAKEPYGRIKHLRLGLFGYASTSIGLIIRKAA
jgi:hypothetical protein